MRKSTRQNLCAGVSCLLSCLNLAARESGEAWAQLQPGVFKQPIPVELSRDPFQTIGTNGGEERFSVTVCNPLSARAGDQLRKQLKGFVQTGATPCILYGRRIVCVGQELLLTLEDSGGRRELRLRLKQIAGDALLFQADKETARLLGANDWACPIGKGGRG